MQQVFFSCSLPAPPATSTPPVEVSAHQSVRRAFQAARLLSTVPASWTSQRLTVRLDNSYGLVCAAALPRMTVRCTRLIFRCSPKQRFVSSHYKGRCVVCVTECWRVQEHIAGTLGWSVTRCQIYISFAVVSGHHRTCHFSLMSPTLNQDSSTKRAKDSRLLWRLHRSRRSHPWNTPVRWIVLCTSGKLRGFASHEHSFILIRSTLLHHCELAGVASLDADTS